MKLGRASHYFYRVTVAFAGLFVILGFVSLLATVSTYASLTATIKLWLMAFIIWLGGWLIRRQYGEKSN